MTAALNAHIELQKIADMAEAIQPAHRSHGIGHAHGFVVVQNLVERRAKHRPQGALDQRLSAFGDELVDDMRVCIGGSAGPAAVDHARKG